MILCFTQETVHVSAAVPLSKSMSCHRSPRFAPRLSPDVAMKAHATQSRCSSALAHSRNVRVCSAVHMGRTVLVFGFRGGEAFLATLSLTKPSLTASFNDRLTIVWMYRTVRTARLPCLFGVFFDRRTIAATAFLDSGFWSGNSFASFSAIAA